MVEKPETPEANAERAKPKQTRGRKQPDTVQVRLKTAVAYASGASRRAGEVVSMPAGQADSWVKHGLAARV